MAEFFIFVKTLADRRPLPLRLLSAVVIHAVEVGAPGAPWLGRHILEWCEQRVRDEELGAPSLNGGLRLLRAADDAGRLPGLAVVLVVPGPPTQKFAAEIRDEDRQFVIERRDLVFEVDGKALVRPEKHLEYILSPQIHEVLVHGCGERP